MADNETLERLEEWAEKVAQESRQLPPDLSEEELREYEAAWYADFYAANPDWAKGGPDDSAMRQWLIAEEDLSPELADAVLNRLRNLAATG
jgi:hypothetical protein